MNIGADAYRTTADVLKAHGAPADQVDMYRDLANKTEAAKTARNALGAKAISLSAAGTDRAGREMVQYLKNSGWTAPEVLQ